jgi:hypothetical protein
MAEEPQRESLIVNAYGVVSPAPNTAPLVRIYADESSTSQQRFMSWGGVWIAENDEAAARGTIAEIRRDAGWKPHGEMKWNKMSGRKCHEAYARLIRTFFELPINFACIVVDTQNPGPNRGDDWELDLYKTLYWLLFKRASPSLQYEVVLDERTNREGDRLSVLHGALNATMRREHAYDGNCFQRVLARKSHDDVLLQLADVLLGAVSFHRNGWHRKPKASGAKCAAAQQIAEVVNPHFGVLQHTAATKTKFNIWCWDPQR